VEQPIGVESYQIDRLITMQITPPGQDFNSLVQFGQTFSGAYAETITLTGIGYATRTFNVAGSFTSTVEFHLHPHASPMNHSPSAAQRPPQQIQSDATL